MSAGPRRWRPLAWVAVLLPFALFVVHASLFRWWLIDDAGISIAYARNLAHGHGLVAQPGVAPVEGFSNPLWTLLIAPLVASPAVDPTLPLKLASLALVLGTFVLVALVARRLFGSSWRSGAVTLASLAFVSLDTGFVVWTTSGLENPLYAFLCALVCLLGVGSAAESGRRGPGREIGAGLVAAALALTRPDGIVFLVAFPLVLAVGVARAPSTWRTGLLRLAVHLGAVLTPIAVYLGFRLVYFGDLLPNTYRAKGAELLSAGTSRFLEDCAGRGLDVVRGVFAGWTVPVLLLLAGGLLHLVVRRWRTSAVVLLLPALLCAGAIYCLLPDDWMAEYRFATPLLLLLPLVLFGLLAELLADLALPSRASVAVFSGVAMLLVLHTGAVHVHRTMAFARAPVVPFAAVVDHCAKQFDDYADELGLTEASLLCPDVGGTLCASRLRVCDLAGLSDRRLARLINTGPRATGDYVLGELCPTFIHVHDYWSGHAGLFADRRFRRLYATIWERPSAWGLRRGDSTLCDGDYVRRDVLDSERALARLRARIHAGTVASVPSTEPGWSVLRRSLLGRPARAPRPVGGGR
jgi:hypothetical protein